MMSMMCLNPVACVSVLYFIEFSLYLIILICGYLLDSVYYINCRW